MSRNPPVAVLVALAILSSAPLAAQTPSPGDWSVVDGQRAGTALVVEIIGGQTIRGTLMGVRDVDLTLALVGGEHRATPKSSVLEVRTEGRVTDPLRNGMTYGGLIGAAAMGAIVAALYSVCELTCDAPSVPTVLFPALALGAGSGIGAGAAVDALIKRPLILFRASSTEHRPVQGRHQ